MNKPIVLEEIGKTNAIAYAVLEVEGGKAYYGGPYTTQKGEIVLSKNPNFYTDDPDKAKPFAIKAYQRGSKL